MQNQQQYRINNLATPAQSCNCTTTTARPVSCSFTGGGTFAVVKTPAQFCPNVIIIPTPPPPRPRPYISRNVVYLWCGRPFTQKDWLNISTMPGFAFTFSCGDNANDPQIRFDRTFAFRPDWWFSLTHIPWDRFMFPNTWEADKIVSDIVFLNQTANENHTLAAINSGVTFIFHPIRNPEVIPIEADATARRACATAGYEYRVTFERDGMEASCKCRNVAACVDEIPCRDARTGHYALRLQPQSLCAAPPTTPPPRVESKSQIGAVVGGVFAGIVAVCVCAWLYYRYQTRWKEKEKARKRAEKLLPPPPMLKVHLGKMKNRQVPEKAKTGYFIKTEAKVKAPSALDKLKSKCFGHKSAEEDPPDVEAEVGVNEADRKSVV